MTYTVKKLADLASVSVRTLHYYDEIGLLSPATVQANGYRQYSEHELLRLQQILFFRELGLSLTEIKAIVDAPDFNVMQALQVHRIALQDRAQRLQRLIDTVDKTIHHLRGEVEMSKKDMFGGLSQQEEKQYYEEAREKYGAQAVDASYKLWGSYSAKKQEQIKAEGSAIYTELAALVGGDPTGTEVQAVIAHWHQHLRYFYEPSVEVLQGLGQMYVDSPDFANKFRAMHPELPEFMQQAIDHYCSTLSD